MKTKAPSKLSILTNGIIKENPVLVLVLGTCPTLATTTSVSTAIGMGIAAAIVLICSNILISLLRKIIPDSVRIPCYIVVIAGFVSVVQMLVQAYFQDLYDALGVYLPLIVVNCIILGRAEMFASKHSVGESALDGIGMGIGFTVTLVVMATLREVVGAGTFAGIPVPFFSSYNIPILTQTPGGFFIFGCLIALVARITHGKVKHAATGCGNCPNAAVCGKIGKEA
ncbi:Na(+)-translocating NADH-quinone reductase, D subunit [Pseudoflavonifractor capillosus ATCC 29799]|uniref:Ion-translocating oxidoreductase complex subunit E n=1 Tax=Pseudoflavonifractor capillosus ATCC 29799 TaxID=411467 RepID=A6NT36_9FIRM|nr:electron transport complex subunit E [Pseudoflavonifractor capillosus]EDN00599.1 Na(+)-translocating NADH-quinone reductase, D subunit [Pseudoflavonifractor capillosus ATCC 29799]